MMSSSVAAAGAVSAEPDTRAVIPAAREPTQPVKAEPGRVALEADRLTVAVNGNAALTEVTIAIPNATSVALLGPNGAGKSTLLRAAVGLVQPRVGSIRIATRRVAFVPQSLAVEAAFPVTAEDVVRMGRYGDLGWIRRLTDRDRELVEEGLRELGVEHLAGRRFGDLSAGERQRVLLAQAVAQDAELLLLDEPFTGVDRPTGDAVRDLLARWRAEGRTVIVATHDLESAARDYDLVVCLNRRVVAFGPAAQTCTEPVLAETFAGHVVRIGELIVDVSHRHHGAG
jgi:manganese/zinc/iron transport system ATP- binding protein